LYGIFSNTDASTSTTTGMLQAYGGVGIRGNINVGGNVNSIAGSLAVGGVFSSGNASVGTLSASGATTVGALTVAGTTTLIGNATVANANVAGTMTVGTLIASNVSFGSLPSLTVSGASALTTATATSVQATALQATAIGNVTPGTAAFTTLAVSSTSAHTGAATFTILTAGGIQSTAIGNVTPGSGAFTSVLASNITSSGNLVTTNGLFWANGINVLSTFAAASALYANTNVASYLPIYTGAVQASSILPNANVTANIGSSTAWFSNVHALTFRGTSTTAQYADLAEVYESDEDYEPGTVLVFGTATEVTISSRYQDNRVAGVVTTNPAYLMNSDANGVAVALQGRVPCRVVGTIHRGDMMITSATPGVATACMPPFGPQIGTVIGKALQGYDSSEVGVIEIVVGRV
jgi:hypothetical protein